MTTNQAAWLESTGTPYKVGPADVPQPDGGEVVIRTRVASVNPIDWKLQGFNFMYKQLPMVGGFEIAGEVHEVGDKVHRFKKGDRVIAQLSGSEISNPKYGGFQLYAVAEETRMALLPDSLSFEEGAVIPIGFCTALVGLCDTSTFGLGLPLPSLNPEPCGKTVVVWGGSSSVGALTIQVAVAAGMKVITTASQHNFDLCKKCGATAVFDRRSPTVVEDVVDAVKSSGGEFGGVYDTVSLPDSLNLVFPILKHFGGGKLLMTHPMEVEAPDNVQVLITHGLQPWTQKFWEDYVTTALQEGKLKCLPEPYVVGKGLESIQEGLDESKKGISAKKLVIQL